MDIFKCFQTYGLPNTRLILAALIITRPISRKVSYRWSVISQVRKNRPFGTPRMRNTKHKKDNLQGPNHRRFRDGQGAPQRLAQPRNSQGNDTYTKRRPWHCGGRGLAALLGAHLRSTRRRGKPNSKTTKNKTKTKQNKKHSIIDFIDCFFSPSFVLFMYYSTPCCPCCVFVVQMSSLCPNVLSLSLCANHLPTLAHTCAVRTPSSASHKLHAVLPA